MNERQIYVAYRLARAGEAVEEAELLLGHGHIRTSVNRLYYACFYAVSALLLAHGLSATTHAGVMRLFSDHFIRTGIVTGEMGKLFHRLFQFRQKSDYEDTFQIDTDRLSQWLPQVTTFVRVIVELIEGTEKESAF